jgi:hypothetical protein
VLKVKQHLAHKTRGMTPDTWQEFRRVLNFTNSELEQMVQAAVGELWDSLESCDFLVLTF